MLETKRIIRRAAQQNTSSFSPAMHPILQRVLHARGVFSDSDIDYTLQALLPFHALKNIDAAATLLADALSLQKKILVVGDFDADGATSCALSLRVLRAFGAQAVDYLVPNRFNYGYGLTPELVEVAQTRQPYLIMTVDNGIANVAGVAAAKAAGIRVLITDHHLAPAVLPEADVIVNPNQPGDHFQSKALAGVGVAFYVMLALRAVLRARNWFVIHKIAEPNLAHYLDIVALGTVADVVPLDRNNRILIAHGLKRVRAQHCIPGITALLTLAKRQAHNITAQDFGFFIGPRLNAAGRMDDMSLGIECLLTDDPAVAMTLAQRLESFNQERRAVESHMQREALEFLSKLPPDQALPLGICLYDAAWHQGVIGILASRIKDKQHRPAIVFANDRDGIIKGSARSIQGVHIRDIFVEVDTTYPGLILKFGGHAMAAGLSLRAQDFTLFTAALNTVLSRHITAQQLEKVLETDGALARDDFTLRFAELLRDHGPWGQNFPEPMFDGKFTVLQESVLAGKYLKLLLMPEDSEHTFEAIAFNINIEQWKLQRCIMAHIVYRLDINEFRERRKLQLIIEQLEVVSTH